MFVPPKPAPMMRPLHAYAEQHSNLTRSVLTRTVTFGARRLIVYLTPGVEFRAGGVIAIASFYRESVALRHIHGARVVLCAVPGDKSESPFVKYSWFENYNYILDLESVLKRCSRLDYLMLHIPAYTVDRMVDWLTSNESNLLSKVSELHLNILLMNIENIQGKNVAGLKRFGKVTCTTAHEAYTNSTTREAMGVPLHRLSVCAGPECYSLSGYREKEALMIVSPDPHPLREKVLHRIAQACPDLTIKIIENLSYRDYRKLASSAKWSLTFGEGFDGYFKEPIFSGGISFAVFNDRYFTPPFSKLENVYPSWEILIEQLPADIKCLDEPVAYNRCWRPAYDLICDLYSTERFRENLRMFYRGEYTFP